MCAPRPSATGPAHFRARCDAWQARVRCDESGDRAEWRPRHSRDPRAHSRVAAAVAPARHAAEESHPPRPGLLASRSGLRQSGHGERDALSVTNQLTLAPALGSIRGIRTRLVAAVDRANATTVHNGPRPINLVLAREPIQERIVDSIPHPRLLPVAQATPARHPRPAPEFLREHLPGNTAAKDEDNAREARAIRDARSPALWASWRNRQQRFDKSPQRLRKQCGGHAGSRYLADGIESGSFVTRS